MSVDSDSGLIKSFIMVLGGLVLFTACIMFLATVVAPPENYEDKLVNDSIQKRIAPVGQIRTAAVEATAGETTAAAPKSAQELYEGICASCHATGVAEAPKTDDAAEWAKRGEVGVDALVATVVSGKGAMPPNGGSAYSESEIKTVVEWLLGQGGEEAPVAAEEAPAEETAPAEEAAEETPAEEPAEETAAANEAAPVAATDEIPAAVKTTVDTICAACHIAGVADAPKFGDTEAWAKRIEAGVETMVATVLSGKGAMPPKGGTQLSDDEVRQAVEYMLTKQ